MKPTPEISPALTFLHDGVQIVKAVLARDEIEEIKADIDLDSEKLRTHGIRNLEKRFDSIRNLIEHPTLRELADGMLGRNALFVRALFFDKTPEKNWFVTWHQDRTVTLNRRIDETRWGPWTVKDGVYHVQPPLAVLESMITFRLHLDAVGRDDGCLEVIPGSHSGGLLKKSEIDDRVRCSTSAYCAVGAGDALMMRPLVLHRSRKAKHPDHRRVVHLEFSSFNLPSGVFWA